MESYIVAGEDRRTVEVHCAGFDCVQKCAHTTRVGLLRLLTRLRWRVSDDRAYCPKCGELALAANAQRNTGRRKTA